MPPTVAAGLHSLERRCRLTKDSTTPFTHTKLPGGKFSILGEDLEEFLSLHAAADFPLNWTERPYSDRMPLLVDIDLRWVDDGRRWDMETVEDFIRGYVKNAQRYLSVDEYEWWLFTKPAPRSDPKQIGVVWKDGFHLVCPRVIASPIVQCQIRKDCLEDPFFEGFADELTTERIQRNDIECAMSRAFDESVTRGKNQWFMYGSKKPDEPHPWKVTARIVASPQDDQVRVVTTPLKRPPAPMRELLEKFSVRLCAERVPVAPLTDDGLALLVPSDTRKSRSRSKPVQDAACSPVPVPVPASVPSVMSQTHPIDAGIAALLACLDVKRSQSRDRWVDTAIVLKSEGAEVGVPDLHFGAWHAFSQRASKYESESDCRKTWDSITPRRESDPGPRLTLGTLRLWAKEDNPQAYLSWRAQFANTPVGVGNQTDNAAVFEALTRCGDLSELHADTFMVLKADADELEFEDPSSGWKGVIAIPKGDKWGGVVYAAKHGGQMQFQGNILTEVPFQRSLPEFKLPGEMMKFVLKQRDEQSAVLESQTCNITKLTVHSPAGTDTNVQVQMPNRKDLVFADKKKVGGLMQHLRAAQVASFKQLNIFIHVAGDLNIAVGGSSTDTGDDPFKTLKDLMLKHTAHKRLMKLPLKTEVFGRVGGDVFRPIPGCPCAYEKAETMSEFLDVLFDDDQVFLSTTKYKELLMRYLTHMNPREIRNIRFERNLMSFKNGVLLLPTAPGQLATFTAYDSPAFQDGGFIGKVASHHIGQVFDPLWLDPALPEPDTPAFDKILLHQFTPEVAHTLRILIGRTLWPVNRLDRWHVVLWLVGLAGTGKSLVLEIASQMHSDECVATLSANQEGIFGLQGVDTAHLLVGRDMPHAMSKVLTQELFQTMVCGEKTAVPVKGLQKVDNRWLVPMIMASNMMPDYKDTNGQISRRIAAFMFEKPVRPRDPTLPGRIEKEQPAIIARAVRAYLTAVDQRGGEDFWDWCPDELRRSQLEVAKATNYVQQFIHLDPEDNNTHAPLLERSEKHGVALAAVQSAFDAYMHAAHPGVRHTDKVNRDTLTRMGFELTKDKNDQLMVCKVCLHSGGKGCCPRYNHDNRKKAVVVKGFRLVGESESDAL
jgi:hypothetical protein